LQISHLIILNNSTTMRDYNTHYVGESA